MELKIEDLWHKCTACEGDGIISSPRDPDIDPISGEHGKKCDRCGGRGMMLTNSGTVLKAFFQMFQDEKI